MSSSSGSANYGTATSLKVKPSYPGETAYLKFNVSGLSGPVQSAMLRVYAISGMNWGFDTYSVANTGWGESTLAYANAPALGAKLGSFPSGAVTGWIQLDVTSAVTGNGTFSFALVGTYWMEISLASRESGANAPQLVVTSAGTPDTSAPSAPASLATASPTVSTLPLSWAASTDNVGVTGYDVYLNGTKLSTTTATSYSFGGLACGTNYTVGVDAYDAAGNVSAVSTLQAKTSVCPDTVAPSTPTAAAVVAATTTSITLGWSGSTDNVGVAGYGLYNGGTTPLATSTGTSYAFTGLSCGTSYTLAVDAFDAAGNRSAKATVTAPTSPCPPDTTPPTAPTNLKVTNPTSSSLPLSWTAATDNIGVTGYDVYLNGTKLTTTTGGTTTYTFTNLTCGTTYTLALDAYDAAGNTSSSATLRGSTAGCGPTVTTFSVVADSYVSSSSGSANYGTATSLKVKPSYPGETAYLKFNVSGLSGPVQSAMLRVYAISGMNWGFDTYSVANTGWGESTLAYANAPALGAKLGSFPSGAVTGWIQLDVTSAVTGNGTFSFALVGTYWMEISLASRESGANAPQLVVTSAGTPDTSAPSAPASLATASPTVSTLPLSWAASTDNVGVTGYDVYLNGTKLSTTTATSYSFGGLACGTNYTVGVDAYDAAGNVSAVSTLQAKTSVCPDTVAPSTPTAAAVVAATTTSITLGWSGSTDNVGVAGYGLYNGGTTPLATSTGTSYAFTGLSCGTSYTLAVDAFDAAGNRSAKATVTAPTSPCPPDTTPPTAPTNLKVTNPTSSSLPLSWTAATDNIGVTGYDVYLNGTKLTTTTGGTTTYTFTNLTCGTTYTLALDAYDAAGNTSPASTVQASTGACPDTTPPAVSITSPLGGAIVSGIVSVQASATDDNAVARVQFELDGTNLGAEVVSPPYAVSWNTAAVANGTHTLSAVARDAAGNSTTASNVVVTVANSGQTSPTPVPAANTYGVTVGTGFVDASTREVVRTTGGAVYVVTADDDPCQGSAGGKGVIRVWKGTGAQAGNPAVPTGFAEQDAPDHPSSAGSGDCTYSGASILGSPDVRLDRAGMIEIAYIDGYDGSVYYQSFSTVTDTWESRAVIGAGGQTTSGSGWPREGQVALTLDANDAPHVVYATSGVSNQLRYTNRAGGTWTMPVIVASGTNLMHPSMVTSLDGALHLAWLANSLATHSTVGYAHYAAGSWSAPETVSAGDSLVLANGDDDQGPSIATDANNTPFVLYMDGSVSGIDDYVRMRYRTAGGTWADDTPPGGSGGASNPTATLFAHTPQNYISSSNGQFVFLGHDANVEFGYQYQLGGVGTSWDPYTTLDPHSATNPASGDTVEPGTDGSASVRFDPLRDNNASLIDVIYYDERDNSDASHHHATLYYKAIVIASG